MAEVTIRTWRGTYVVNEDHPPDLVQEFDNDNQNMVYVTEMNSGKKVAIRPQALDSITWREEP